MPKVVAPVEDTGGYRWGRCWEGTQRRGPGRIAAAGLLGTIVLDFERGQHADCGVELEVPAARTSRGVHTVAEGGQHAAEGWGPFRPHDAELIQLHVVQAGALVQFASPCPSWNTKAPG